MIFKMEPVVRHQPIYTSESPELYTGLTNRMNIATRKMQLCFLHALGAVVVALLGFGSGVTQTAYVLVFVSTLCTIWFAMRHAMYDSLLHVLDMRESLAPATTGEDWLAYHLAERVEAEQRAEQAAMEAIAAAEAAMQAADEAARSAERQVH